MQANYSPRFDRGDKSGRQPNSSLAALADFVRRNPGLLVITGAGISLASGIPTYRDDVGSWKSRTPIQHNDFLNQEATRRRYWVRSFVGWPTIAGAEPNKAHRALTVLESLGYVDTLITQNVDRLHQKSGHGNVVDLHGRLDQVLCMDCSAIHARSTVQQWLLQSNPQLEGIGRQAATLAPDGDAEVESDAVGEVRVPTCIHCDGLLKPNVVFYGSSVPKDTVDILHERVSRADAVLVVGSSLMVYSSFRFCKYAADNDIPIACINQGVTRADNLFEIKIAADCGQVLQQLAESLPPRPA